MQLPTNLYSIQLSYILDDRDLVEKLLDIFPLETEHCIPSALRQILSVRNYTIPFFSKNKLVLYLRVLWHNFPPPNGGMAAASEWGLTHIIPYLLDRSTNINPINFDSGYPLRWAANYGHTETVSMLLDCKADIHARNDDALVWATRQGHCETITLLLDRKADIHVKRDLPLCAAAGQGHIETVILLLDRKADINPGSDSPLKYAIMTGQTRTVKLLLDRKANIHTIEETTLRSAMFDGHGKTVALIRSYLDDYRL